MIPPRAPPGGVAARPGPSAHYCEHPGCDAWGAFGFGRRALRWFCFAHQAVGEAGLALAGPAPVADARPKNPGQGSLF